FVSTGEYYLRYRLPYPEALLSDLAARAQLSGRGRLLDLACGPGRIALDLAPRFAEVWALDLEPEMIAVAREEAARRNLDGVKWLVGPAETLEAPAGAFELITIGEAFHRLDQPLIAARALEWLAPGAHMATMGGHGATVGPEPWQQAARDVVRRYARHQSPGDGPPPGWEEQDEGLRRAGFEDVAGYQFTVAHEWTAKAIVGHLYSTSYCSKAVLGDRAGAFEAELTAELLALDPTGRFRQEMTFGYTLARRPSLTP
ncbi:MAG: class I SAM-dependent methyltransferase, partial [Caulobacterales bacterium]